MLIVIEHQPIAKARHRYTVRGKFVQTYDPQSVTVKEVRKEMERQVSLMPDFSAFPTGVALNLQVTYHFEPPKSWSKKKRKEMIGKYHTQKPDCTNLTKFYEDVGNGLLWPDDCQIADQRIIKKWAEEPRVIIRVIEIDD